MYKVLIPIALMLFTSCAYDSSGRMEIPGESMVYSYDPRTNLCFAASALRKPVSMEIEQYSMTAIPCNQNVVNLSGKRSSIF